MDLNVFQRCTFLKVLGKVCMRPEAARDIACAGSRFCGSTRAIHCENASTRAQQTQLMSHAATVSLPQTSVTDLNL